MKTVNISKRLKNYRYRYEKRCDAVWEDTPLLSASEVSDRISHAILNKDPFLVGKIGNNEQLLMLWAARIPIDLPLGLKWFVNFPETYSCATNAGVKPYTEVSYYELYKHFINTLSETDILGVFKLPREKKLWQELATRSSVCQHIHFTPFFCETPWSKALSGKRVFVVSPFLELFQQQLAKRHLIWPASEVLPEVKLDGYSFPYLIEEDCVLSWQSVYQDVLEAMQSHEFDVALLGCGALGFPLAYEAKRLGKVGIHLGGTMQLLFGISGQRYRKQPHFSKYINEHWTSPPASSRPQNYKAIENGCYW